MSPPTAHCSPFMRTHAPATSLCMMMSKRLRAGSIEVFHGGEWGGDWQPSVPSLYAARIHARPTHRM